VQSQKKLPKTFSFEFYPPKTAAGKEKLRATWRQLGQLKPKFFSCTYGAGGSARPVSMRRLISPASHPRART
jgi:methylenetetrahydrofolate reductase (NADPH)